MLYFDLLDDNIILTIIEIRLNKIESEIRKIEDDIEYFTWDYYESSNDDYDYDSDFDKMFGM
jgi:hypothetical protein|tara:strand:+ start:1623 stop:1808 length:186 start_codon:yes stop_codon:yes gene_type:complete